MKLTEKQVEIIIKKAEKKEEAKQVYHNYEMELNDLIILITGIDNFNNWSLTNGELTLDLDKTKEEKKE